jgi:HSP20 family protein
MNLHEDTQNNTVIRVSEDVDIDVHNGRLTIIAENKTSSEHDENGA